MIRESVLKESQMNASKQIKEDKPLKKSKFAELNDDEPEPLMTQGSDSNSDIVEEINDQIFADTKVTKDLFGKFLCIRLFHALLLFTNIVLGLTTYEFLAINPTDDTTTLKFINAINTITTISSIGTWILSNVFEAKLKRARLDLNNNVTYLQDYGYLPFFINLLIFLIHPFEPFMNVPFFWKESYFEPTAEFVSYNRPTIEHLIMIQFTFNTILIIKIVIEVVKYANNRARRIAKFFDVELDFTYMIRAMMKAYPMQFMVFMQIFGVIFFGVLFRIAESGYLKHTPKDAAGEFDQDIFDERSVFFLYGNTFWHMMITMSTIGYGDIYAKSTFGRFIIIIIGIYGMLTTSLLIVAFTNLLTMEIAEDNAYAIIRSIQAEKDKKLAAINLTSNILRAGVSYFKGDLNERNELKEKFTGDIKEFIDAFNNLRTMNMDEYTYISTKAYLISSVLKKWDIAKSIEDAEESKYKLEIDSEEKED